MMNYKLNWMKNWVVLFFLIFLRDFAFGQTIVEGANVVVQSPNKNLSIQFYQKEDADK